MIPAPSRLDLRDEPGYLVDGEVQVHGQPSAATGEHYRIRVRAHGIEVDAGPAGWPRARAVIAQLVALTGPTIPALDITDQPRYRWRGLMIDIARHYFGPEILREVIDLAASYGLNVLHLHLTDDQGWRLQVPGRPELTDHSGPHDASGGAGGYLSTADYTGLVRYAGERGIAVIGEIDLPGHSNAALHAVPELNPDGRSADAYAGTDVGFSTLESSLPATGPFVADVLGELARLGGAEFVHIGADEVQRLPAGDYLDFVAHLEQVVADAGKRTVAWQEAAAGLCRPDSLVQFWDCRLDPGPVIDAAGRGLQVILSPAPHTYLDMKTDPGCRLGQDWAGFVDLRASYDWDPEQTVPGLPPSAIAGVEAALWTETIRTRDDLFDMLLPRLAAIAEVAWTSQQQRSWEQFAARVQVHRQWWRERGYLPDASGGTLTA